MSVYALPGYITTIAGRDNGDGGPAITAQLEDAIAIAVDTAGNIYFSEKYRVRKITVGTGAIATVAGTGLPGAGGDGGPGILASLGYTAAVALDSVGNIYIADSDNNRIRKVTVATGVITTIAGTGIQSFSGDDGPAVNASLSQPTGVALDNQDNIYIADKYNHRVRKITASTGVITTIAGTGVAGFSGDNEPATNGQLNSPSSVAVDSFGWVYIADTSNNRVRGISTYTRVIYTAAGTGATAGPLGDNGPATSATVVNPLSVAVDIAKNFYVVEQGRVRRVAFAGGAITTVAGTGTSGFSGDGGAATSAQLATPRGTTLDNLGNMYVADSANYRIRKVTANSGVISTVGGIGAPDTACSTNSASLTTFNQPAATAVDVNGNVYISDRGNHCIRKLTLSTGVVSKVAGTGGAYGFSGDGGLATSATLWNPAGVALDTAGNLYVADATNQRVRKIAAGTGLITTVAGTGVTGYSGDGGLATNAKLGNPLGVAIDDSGNIYIADSYNSRIRKVTVATGIISTVAGTGAYGFSGDNGPATAANLYGPGGVVLDRLGNIYISDYYNHRIRKVVAATGIITTIAGSGIEGFSGDGGSAINANLSSPNGVAIDMLGNIFISDESSRIRKVNAATGVISTIAGGSMPGFSGDNGPAIAALLARPAGVSVDRARNVYIADQGNNRIRKVTANLGTVGDVSGDNQSDILFRDTNSGLVNAALMNGVVSASIVSILPAGSGWTVSHVADLDGDALSDLITRHTDGRVNLLIMNGTTVTSNTNLITAGTGWTVTHAADLNGDGKADLVLKNSDGRIAVLIMNGTSVVTYKELTAAGSSYTPTHVGDFNGDGKADIILKHSDGSAAILLMDGAIATSAGLLLGAGSPWSVSHVADLDGDGKADVIIKSVDGAAVMLLMNGTTATSAAFLLTAGSGYTVTHTGDFNGDGKADLLIKNNDGSVVMLQMNGTTVSAASFLLLAGSTSTVAQVADYNGDGKSDILLRTADGSATAILMNGAVVTAAGNVWGAGTLQVVP